MDERLQRLRAADRIDAPTVIRALVPTLVHQRGDRLLGDDAALTAGFGRLVTGATVAVLGVDRGTDVASRRAKNGGALTVAGYRTATRVMRHAEKFGFPVISLINMPGADASPQSERYGQSRAIADLIALSGQLRVPNVAVFLGEGHSGGALAFANANRIIMLDDALFNVASPESVAAILRGQQSPAQAIDLLPMTVDALLDRHLVDQVVNHQEPDLLATLVTTITQAINGLSATPATTLIAQRETKFNQFMAAWPLN